MTRISTLTLTYSLTFYFINQMYVCNVCMRAWEEVVEEEECP
jgi:hypothetical protein